MPNCSLRFSRTVTSDSIGVFLATVVFLFDVDNTLLDNDAVTDDLKQHLIDNFGHEPRRVATGSCSSSCAPNSATPIISARCSATGSSTRAIPHCCGVALPAALRVREPRLPGALDAIRHAEHRGRVAILSDGDVVFQPRKVERSGLWGAVEGDVLIYIHKEEMLDDVERRFPAERYVMIDDKIRILDGDESRLGRAPDDGLRPPGPLRARSGARGEVSAGRRHHRAHR